ncbi:hypothetical protein DENSPDRAFT_339100 [Dentipellis sp. KUC8613]|nr:hypothetical protein DENSPDRAFT_339100 [Dentipellis sp. KUC8613]
MVMNTTTYGWGDDTPPHCDTIDDLLPMHQERLQEQMVQMVLHRKQLEDQIEFHQNIIRDHEAIVQQLRVQLNVFRPTCSLPLEVLAHIFLLCISRQPSGRKDGQRMQRATPWPVSFSHVCRHWREVCLQTTHLWTSVTDFLPGKWPSVYFERSRRTPLRVDITLEWHSRTTINLILANMPRIRFLAIYNDAVADIVNLANCLAIPAPILQEATFHALKQGYRGESAHGFIFAGSAPQLRILKLLGDPAIMQDIPSFPSLTELKTENVLSISGAVDFVRQNPRLECLRMVDPEFNAYAPPLEPIPDVSELPVPPAFAPYLYSIFVKAQSVARVVTLLRAIEAPQLNTLFFGVHVPVVTENTETRSIKETLLDALASRISMSQQCTGKHQMGQFRSLTLDYDPLGRFSIIGRTGNLPRNITSLVEEHRPESQVFHLVLSWRNSRDYRPNYSKFTLLQVMDLVLSANRFAFENIRVLIITNDLSGYLTPIDVPTYDWPLYFCPLVGTKILWFSNRCPDPALLLATTPSLSEVGDSEEQKKTPIFPLLREVHITFKETYTRPGLLEAWPFLRQLAKARKQGNARLIIQLERCDMPREMLDTLREDAWVLEDGEPLPEGAEILS